MEQRLLTLCLIASFMGLLLPLGEAIWLKLPPSEIKCVSEEIQHNVMVTGNYNVIFEDQTNDVPAINARLTSPFGNIIREVENVTDDQFEFKTTKTGSYILCFWMYDNRDVVANINLDWKVGISTRDWDSVSKHEKLEGVELGLWKNELIVDYIHETMLRLRSREAEMRMVSETTNTRVAMFSIMSLGMCVMVSAVQLWNLRRYFEKKRII
ncbi:PREDICTED: transmembrane emp24 domain-containing protein p24delta3-like [Nelumbo nucifera]|nr:PREDICTED: transmembrane emp24 domain-containing protein p24delta3-like [Nelumbo nucifera]